MSKFKVGDKVKALWAGPTYPYEAGDVGKVVLSGRSDVWVFQLEDGTHAYALGSNLELVEDNIQNWWETPEGIEWLSTQQDVEEQFLKSQEKREERTYQVGQRFLVTCYYTEYTCILAQVSPNNVCLINLESGNRINEPIRVCDSRKITEEEMKMIAGDCTFQLL